MSTNKAFAADDLRGDSAPLAHRAVLADRDQTIPTIRITIKPWQETERLLNLNRLITHGNQNDQLIVLKGITFRGIQEYIKWFIPGCLQYSFDLNSVNANLDTVLANEDVVGWYA